MCLLRLAIFNVLLCSILDVIWVQVIRLLEFLFTEVIKVCSVRVEALRSCYVFVEVTKVCGMLVKIHEPLTRL